MKDIRIEKVSKAYNGEMILDNLSLTIPGGKFFALLGPSGSGKTTLLRLIAGFETVDDGHIYIGDQDVTHVPINYRKVNTVFQNYALFPHLNVFDNIAYGLHIKKVPADVVEYKVAKVLKSIHLEKQMYKSIAQLSGGQQQRVALARAIVNEPEVLLLDEPLAALDLKLRERMLIELIDIQSALNTTFVYVTHDQLEALTVADQMAIMNYDGQIEQMGTPKQIYEFPQSSFVAQFVGTTNIAKGTLVRDEVKDYIEIPGWGTLEVALPAGKDWAQPGSSVLMSLRPEKIEITKVQKVGFSNCLQGMVQSIVYHGRSTQYNVLVGENNLIQVFEQNEDHFPDQIIDYDDKVYLYWQKENAVLLER